MLLSHISESAREPECSDLSRQSQEARNLKRRRKKILESKEIFKILAQTQLSNKFSIYLCLLMSFSTYASTFFNFSSCVN